MPYAACECTSAIPRRGGPHSSGASTSGSDGSKSADGGGSTSGSDGSKSADGGGSISGCSRLEVGRWSVVKLRFRRLKVGSGSLFNLHIGGRGAQGRTLLRRRPVPGSPRQSRNQRGCHEDHKDAENIARFVHLPYPHTATSLACSTRPSRDTGQTRHPIRASPLAHFSQAKAPRWASRLSSLRQARAQEVGDSAESHRPLSCGAGL